MLLTQSHMLDIYLSEGRQLGNWPPGHQPAQRLPALLPGHLNSQGHQQITCLGT